MKRPQAADDPPGSAAGAGKTGAGAGAAETAAAAGETAAAEAPSGAVSSAPRRDTSTRGPARALALAVAALAGAVPAVRAGEYDAIHQMRVQARTVRGLLTVFEKQLGGRRAASLADAVKRLGRVLGTARDAEVAGELFRSRIKQLPPDLTGKRLVLRGDRLSRRDFERARAVVLAELERPRFSALMADLQALAEDAAAGDTDAPGSRSTDARATDAADAADAQAVAAVHRAAAKVRRRIDRTVAAGPDSTPDQLHRARKAARQLRYIVRSTGIDPGAGITKDLLDALGEHHDSLVLQEFLRRAGRQARKAGEDSFGYGILWGREFAEQEQALEAVLRHSPPVPDGPTPEADDAGR